jgi:hypothetical protein
MNRRDMLKSAAAVSVVGTAYGATHGSGDAAYVTGAPQCGECKAAMPAEFIEGRPLTWCVNERCGRYEVKYVLPMTVLERA